LDYIASGEIAITGVGSGLRERIDGAVFAHCRVDYPFQDANFDLIMTEEFYLSSCPFVDEAHWQKGFNDKFRNGRECRWVQLLVHKPDIARIWEFGGQHGPIVNDELLPSGAPGRPSVMHLVVREFERRCAAGELEEGVAEQSRVLAQWLLDAHPNAKRLTPKTIENNIRAGFRRAKDPRN
jgi:hypothetical protein